MPRRMKRFGARPSHTTRRSRITKKHKARWEVSIRGKSTHHVDERERSFDAARAKEGEAVSMASLLSKQRDRRVWEGTRFQRFLRDSHTILAKTSGGEHSQILMERNTRVIDRRIAFSLLSWGGGAYCPYEFAGTAVLMSHHVFVRAWQFLYQRTTTQCILYLLPPLLTFCFSAQAPQAAPRTPLP